MRTFTTAWIWPDSIQKWQRIPLAAYFYIILQLVHLNAIKSRCIDSTISSETPIVATSLFAEFITTVFTARHKFWPNNFVTNLAILVMIYNVKVCPQRLSPIFFNLHHARSFNLDVIHSYDEADCSNYKRGNEKEASTIDCFLNEIWDRFVIQINAFRHFHLTTLWHGTTLWHWTAIFWHRTKCWHLRASTFIWFVLNSLIILIIRDDACIIIIRLLPMFLLKLWLLCCFIIIWFKSLFLFRLRLFPNWLVIW